MKITLTLMCLLFSFSCYSAHATGISDQLREQRWANQVIDFLVDGEPRWLDANGQKFLSIYTPAVSEAPTGAVILLHGRGLHPDWPQVIQPLRTQLPGRGWATLSLQMPVLGNDASDEDYIPLFANVPARIQSGIDFLNLHGMHNIVLIGHSLGSNMATDYLAKYHAPDIKAFIGIGMTAKPQPSEYLLLDNVSSILQMKVPILDVYGSQTYPSILESVDRRAFAISAYQVNKYPSQQIKVNGANHYFQGHENKLLQVIINWINKVGRQIPSNKLLTVHDQEQKK